MRWPRVRFTLGTALIGITATAILFGMVAYWTKPPTYRAAIYLSIRGDGDLATLAHDLLSDAVLDSALMTPGPLGPGLAAMSAFRDAADPVAGLRRRLRVERPAASPDVIGLWTLANSPSDAQEIVSAVAASCQRSWGARRVCVSAAFTDSVSRSDYPQWFLLTTAMQFLGIFVAHQIRKRRARAVAEVRPRAPESSTGPNVPRQTGLDDSSRFDFSP